MQPQNLPRDNIYEQVIKEDFNRTEYETLRQLVDSAIKIGEEIKGDYVRLRQLSIEFLELLKREGILKAKQFETNELTALSSKLASASDGSFQSVGGADGKWYVPISAALVIFRGGLNQAPEVRLGARIQTIDEREHHNLGGAMETAMLYGEASVMKDWARDCPPNSTHFIDGPVIDPPRQMDKEYTTYRTDAIKGFLNKKVLALGCVKKLLGNFLIQRMEGILPEFEKERLLQFHSDAYLIYHVLTKASLDSIATLYTKPLEVSDKNSVYKSYKDAGLDVYFMYFQRDPLANPFRVDIPVLAGTQVNAEQLGEQVAAVLSAWSYPGYDLPLPIVIADNKCNIRKGCAEVLYREIITRAASNDLFDNIVRTKLRTEVT